MTRFKILLVVTTYPLPSRSYDELVCTAGITEDGSWIRIYPMPLSFLREQKLNGNIRVNKYTWIEINLVSRQNKNKDFRPESFSPVDYNFKDLKVLEHIDTKNNWAERKKYCLKNVYTDITKLIKDSGKPQNKSLATFYPTIIIDFIIEPDKREWKAEWKSNFIQYQLNFDNPENVIKRKIPRKLPYKFKYVFLDDKNRQSVLMIEDWEIEELYWKSFKYYGTEEKACEAVKQKYFYTFLDKNDIYFFLGTQYKHHVMRHNNPFVIVGVFYPLKKNKELFNDDNIQLSLF